VVATPADELRERVGRYLRGHHTMTLATMGVRPGQPPSGGGAASGAGAEREAGEPVTALAPGPAVPHAASVFYAVDDAGRLIFLSSHMSSHGLHIGTAAPVAVTVTEQYDDWEAIQGVQLWGTAKRLDGAARAKALAVYFFRFPFVPELMEQPRLAESVRKLAIYRVEPERIAFTDNTTGVFGREVLDLKG
jgi:uncharacterized protein YhbP (UPF0306 family)